MKYATWSTLGRGMTISTLALTLVACQSMKGSKPAI